MVLQHFLFNNKSVLIGGKPAMVPLLSGNMKVFISSVTFMQEMENCFNYQTHGSFTGNT